MQALRAAAALAVVAGHSTDFLLVANGSVPPAFRYLHGPAGVDIFFVISGFVMMISGERLRTRPHPARLFLWRRVIRIVPLYWLLTIAKYVTTRLDPALSVRGRPAAAELIASLLFVPYRAVDGWFHPLIPVGWTLSFEMVFYLIFAAALTVRNGLRWVLAPMMLLLATVGLFRGPGWPVWTELADPIVLEFLAGAAIARLAMERSLPGRVFAMCFLVLGAGILGGTFPTPVPISRLMTWGLGAMLLVLGVVALEPLLGPWLPRWLLILGSASYSIYLVQSFVFPVLHGALARLAPNLAHARPALAGGLMLVCGVAATAVAGVALFRAVEQPMDRMLRRRLGVAKPEPVTP